MASSNKRRYCTNCHYPLPQFGQYCSHCSQKYTDGKVTVWALIKEFVANILSLENRLWQTIVALFVPGRLTKAFFGGQQARYVSPFRIFFITGIFFFAIVNYWGDDFNEREIEQAIQQQTRENTYSIFLQELQEACDTLAQDLPQYADPVLDSLLARMQQDYEDSTWIGLQFSFGDGGSDDSEEAGVELGELLVAKEDIVQMSTDSLVETYAGDASWLQRLMVRQSVRFQKAGDSYVGFLTSKLVWMMLLMMPFLALLLKIFYIRRPYFYVEHLIFCFHIHAFAFLVVGIAFATNFFQLFEYVQTPVKALATSQSLWGVATGGSFLYFLLSLKRVYEQPWGKTILKFFLLNFCYFFLFVVALVITFIATALVY